MNVDWIFAFISGTSAALLLLFPGVVLMFMYKMTFGIMRLQGLEIPNHYEQDYELLLKEPTEFFIKYKGQQFMLRLTGIVALFLFLASISVPISKP